MMPGWTFSSTAYARGSNPVTAAPFSLSIWCVLDNVGAGGNNDCIATICRSSANNHYWNIQKNTTDNKLQFQCNAATGNRSATTVNTVTQGVAFNVTIIAASATDRKIILNGDIANAGTNATSTTPTSIDRISFGRKDDADANVSMDGTIFSAALWNGALTDGHAVSLSNGAWPADIFSSKLYSFWPNFRDRGDGIIQDWCGRNPLTINSGSLATASVRRQGPHSILPPSLKRTRILRVA